MYKLILIPVFIFSLISCADLNKKKQIERIDAMETSLDSLKKIHEAEKTDSLFAWSQTCYAVEKRVKENYTADTIDLDFGKKMDAFKVMRRNLKPVGKSMNALRTGIEEEREALKKLRNDIDNGNGERDKYDEYLTYEEQKVQQLRTLCTEFVDTKKACQKTFDELYEELATFSYSLEQKNKEK